MNTTANTKTLLTVKIDKDLKLRAEKTAASFGLPLGTMVNAIIRRTVEDGELTLRTPLVPTKRLRESIRESRNETRLGKDKIFDSMEELLKDLNS